VRGLLITEPSPIADPLGPNMSVSSRGG
jgi:hypothetical protein